MTKSACGILALIVFAAGVFAGTDAWSQILRPARAVYDLRLNQSRDNSGVDAAKGRLVVELMEDCAGYVFNQGFITRINSSEAPEMIGNMQASVWESRDGRTLRFNLVNNINGKTVERERGRAELDAAGAGDAAWQLPAERRLALPKGTLFPITYNRTMLRAAMAGSRGFETTLFDGSNDAGYYHASVFIGDELSPSRDKRSKLLAKALPSWPVRLAYYHHDNSVGTPEFEVGFTLYGDGIVDELFLDYPKFGLTGQLVELEYLERPECD
ncbi:MAG: DUF1849 family protein [Alphaproteobacteria bacterium]|nr:DUF1849 family protein [Alphaproteobacteria bacterium]